MRLFISLHLPEVLIKWIQHLDCNISGARYYAGEQLHLTLKFIGEVQKGQAEEIQKKLHHVQSPFFSLQLKTIGCFSNRGKPSVLWVGVEPSQGLVTLKEKIDRVLIPLVSRDKHRFHPHVTLARLSDPDPRSLEEFLAAHKDIRSQAVPIKEFALYRSELTPQKAIHTRLERYILNDIKQNPEKR